MQLYGLELEIPDQVYAPAEDTDLCVEWLKEWANRASKYSFVLEIGCGPGTCSLFLQKTLTQLGKKACIIVIDINPFATKITMKNARQNSLSSDFNIIQCDLTSPLYSHHQILPKFDLIFFNPPYLPAEKDVIDSHNQQPIDAAWEGGLEGDEITLTFLSQIPSLLEKEGSIMFITSSHVDQSRIHKIMKMNDIIIVDSQKIHIFFEDIILIHGKIGKLIDQKKLMSF